MRITFLFVPILLLCVYCGKSDNPVLLNTRNDLVIKSAIITQSFIGNGAQWGGYDILSSWTGSPTLSNTDWDKLFKRVRFMRPPLMRIMVTGGWNYLVNNQFDPTNSDPVLIKILDFCQAEGISVMLGEWGHTGGTTIDADWLGKSSRFLEWLVLTKNYTCIKYFNMVNEPNGDWSSINGNYQLWRTLIEQFHAKLIENGLASKIMIIGPDIAIWNKNSTAWVSNANSDLGSKLGACDIHTYPNEEEVRNGSYRGMVKAYRDAAPASKEMVMGELGFKYVTSSVLSNQNLQRIAADKYASDDSNMFVYDAFYGIDIADAMIQNMLAGYAGNILWDLDDAMYNVGGANSTKLKRWGFWNILGSEKFEKSADEDIRPWFYTASLLCRYFPQGTTIHEIGLPDKLGLRAIAGEKNGKYSIAIVNSGKVMYSVDLKMEAGILLQNLKVYKFVSGDGSAFTANVSPEGFAQPLTTGQVFHLTNGESEKLEIPAQSFYLITNLDE